MKQLAKQIQKWSAQVFPESTLEGQKEKVIEECIEVFQAKTKDETLKQLADVFVTLVNVERLKGYNCDFKKCTFGMHLIGNIIDRMKGSITEAELENCFFCLFDTVKFYGFTQNQLTNAIETKFEKLKSRTWEYIGEGMYHHVEGAK